jgi:hypothetical protein
MSVASVTSTENIRILKGTFVCSMATKVIASHFKILSQESVISTARTLGKGTLTDLFL